MKAEARGRDREWRVYYPNEAGLASPVEVYDQDGVVNGHVFAGAPDKEPWTESYAKFDSAERACAYARYLGATEVRVVRKLTKEQALDKARAAKKENA